MSKYSILLLVTVGFGVARFLVPVEGAINHNDIFKDIAHIWVGILFGIAGTLTYQTYQQFRMQFDTSETLWLVFAATFWWWLLAIGLTILEVVAFVVRKV